MQGETEGEGEGKLLLTNPHMSSVRFKTQEYTHSVEPNVFTYLELFSFQFSSTQIWKAQGTHQR